MTGPLTLAHRTAAYPLAAALIRHSLSQLGAQRMPGLVRAYADQQDAFFHDLETETAGVLRASDQTLAQCLQDLDAFNALTPETENDVWYDHLPAFTSMHLDALLLGFSRRRLGVMVEQLSESSIERALMLDVGGGSGRLAGLLLREHPAWRAALVDRSAAAVAFSRAHLEATGRGGRVDCRHGDLAAIPFDDASFDVVIAAEVLEHTPDAQTGAVELLRVLKPGGRLVISLPIDLNIAMHPTVFATVEAILQFFGKLPLTLLRKEVVQPDTAVDAICDVFPDFKGCLNAIFVRDMAPR